MDVIFFAFTRNARGTGTNIKNLLHKIVATTENLLHDLPAGLNAGKSKTKQQQKHGARHFTFKVFVCNFIARHLSRKVLEAIHIVVPGK
jgi:hypothetical protein